MRARKIGPLVLGLALLLGTYQNCALHQSESRKLLEKMLSQSAPSYCLPYLSNSMAVEIFATTDPVDSKWVRDSEGVNCLISAVNQSSGADVISCRLDSMAKTQVDLVVAMSDDTTAPSPFPPHEDYLRFQTDSGAGYYIGGRDLDGRAAVEAYSAVPQAADGIKCLAVFADGNEYQTYKTLAIERVKALVSEMAHAL